MAAAPGLAWRGKTELMYYDNPSLANWMQYVKMSKAAKKEAFYAACGKGGDAPIRNNQ